MFIEDSYNMLSRQYTRKVKVYKTYSTADGYGGNTVSDVLIGSFWAEVKQNSSFKDNALGKADIKNTYSFKIRANSVLTPDLDNLKIEYRGAFYVVNDIRYDDELFRELNIIANG